LGRKKERRGYLNQKDKGLKVIIKISDL